MKPAQKEEPKAIASENKLVPLEVKDFSGKMWTIVYRPHNGFANYAIAEVVIDKGKVMSVTMDQAHAGFEIGARLELKYSKLLEEMRVKYPANHRHV